MRNSVFIWLILLFWGIPRCTANFLMESNKKHASLKRGCYLLLYKWECLLSLKKFRHLGTSLQLLCIITVSVSAVSNTMKRIRLWTYVINSGFSRKWTFLMSILFSLSSVFIKGEGEEEKRGYPLSRLRPRLCTLLLII